MTRSHSDVVKLDADGLPIARPCCLKCIRPPSHCVCQSLKSFEAHFNLLILQHPHERKKYYSTAKLVLGSITNSRMIRGVEFEESFLEKTLSGSNFYLLYPGKDAQDCENIELGIKDTVVVLDGTWAEAGKLLYRNPILKNLPKISFNREIKSAYRIRKQPKERYLSTLESVAHLLKLNADCSIQRNKNINVNNYDSLLDIFSEMVTKQLEYFPRMKNPANTPELRKFT